MTVTAKTAIMDVLGLLLIREKGVWKLPGGKLKPGESLEECLLRELEEEMPSLRIFGIRPYKVFNGQTYFKKRDTEMHVYLASLVSLTQTSFRGIEGFAITRYPEDYQLTPLTRVVAKSLKKDGYI